MLGRSDKAIYAPRALAIYEELDDLNGQGVVHGNMGFVAYFDGEWAEAIEHYRRSRDAFLRIGNVVQAANGESNMAEVLVNQGRIDEARPLLEEARRIFVASNWLDGASFVEVQLARVLASEGRTEEAVELFHKARKQFEDLGETASVAELVVYLATCYLDAGRPQDALAAVEEVETLTGEVDNPGVMRVKGLALAELGNVDDGRAIVQEGLTIAEDQGIPYEEALLLMACDQLRDEAEEDRSRLARALEILDDLGVAITHPEVVTGV
jgi:tetratricopeptide (TPR) repeat protein